MFHLFNIIKDEKILNETIFQIEKYINLLRTKTINYKKNHEYRFTKLFARQCFKFVRQNYNDELNRGIFLDHRIVEHVYSSIIVYLKIII